MKHRANKAFLSVIVPVFNEATAIRGNLELLFTELEHHFEKYEIIVVDDGSTDDTALIISEVDHPKLVHIFLEHNQGKGFAVRRGFERASGDYLLFIDGGMELHPREIKIFLGLMKIYQADIVVGSKRHPQSKVSYPWYRRLLSFGFQLIVRFLFSISVTDTQVGIKMFRRQVIQDILPHLRLSHYGFDLEILGLAAKFGHRNVLEAPVRLDYFLKNNRSTVKELAHTFRVGTILLKDVILLWLRLRNVNK